MKKLIVICLGLLSLTIVGCAGTGAGRGSVQITDNCYLVVLYDNSTVKLDVDCK
ncbi:MAG: hypothetical protein HQK95_05370 [Nitrospirae bacterium]|nr:hypothetical protein [Nitrospirota bacterium]